MVSAVPKTASHGKPLSNIVDRARTNWNERKVELMGATVSALTLVDTIATASILGGPIILIVAIALIALFALVEFLQALVSPPKNVVAITPAQQESSKTLITAH